MPWPGQYFFANRQMLIVPRLAHALLPVPGERDSNWSYSWIPVIAPLLGGALAALLAGIR